MTCLEAEDDVASILWGGGWRMPDIVELQLLDTDIIKGGYNDDYDGNGLPVYIFSGTCLYSSAELIFPAAGYIERTQLYNYTCEYWSRSVCEDDPSSAYCLRMEDECLYIDHAKDPRFMGLSIRPVILLPE